MWEQESTITDVAKKYCEKHGIEYTDNVRRKFSRIINNLDGGGKSDANFENEKATKKEKTVNIEDEEEVFSMPSAWSSELNRFYSIEEYCNKFNLSFDNLEKYNLVAHNAGHMVYNVRFKPTLKEVSGIDEEFIESVVKKHIKPADNIPYKKDASTSIITNMTYTDSHIGLEPDKYNNSLYGGVWNRKELMTRMKEMVVQTVNKSIQNNSEILYIRDFGDTADGYNGYTTRGGHDLPQNMTNTEVFDTAVEFKVVMVDLLIATGQYSQIICENVCNSNHGGDFDYFINSAAKYILETKYENVSVNNHRKFISHYGVGKHCFIISHGKDDKTLKFGFKPVLDTKAIEKIDQYIKGNNLYNKYEYFHFCKGDSHQFLLDFTTSQDFDYFNYPAFSPASQWVQNNFKKGVSGYVVEVFDLNEEEIDISYKKFKWKN
ncbi:MAG: hypothetical protein CMH22_05565 [Methylophaga sp.]|nr:hypothetical protein [Methylophaga sp.]